MPQGRRRELRQVLTPKLTPYIRQAPTERQTAFLLLDEFREAIYGGAAGGGKSSALLSAALQHVDQPGYAALLLRRTYRDLSLPGALMDRAADWLGPTAAVWRASEYTWHFPSGATLTFGYLESENDKYRYQGAEFQFVGFDELTQFSESQYRYLFSRLRRLAGAKVPVRMRSASNPGGVGHDWVKRRLIDEGRQHRRIFIPARLVDNPHVDQIEYMRSLNELDPVTRKQLLAGDWTAREPGGMFQRERFVLLRPAQVPEKLDTVRAWDLAATVQKPGQDPDWTVGVRMSLCDDRSYVIDDVVRFRGNPAQVEKRIQETARRDGMSVRIFMEQEPGSSGKIVIDHYMRNVLNGFAFEGYSPDTGKSVRAGPYSSMVDAQNVCLVAGGGWLGLYLDELEAFPTGSHDDQVDASSLAFTKLTEGNVRIRTLG